MRPYGALGGRDEAEVREAGWEAARGAVIGATKWGLYAAALGAAGYTFSPVYRGLTIQFKVYLQMSGMLMGGWMEADRRMRAFETAQRVRRRMLIDRMRWEKFEQEFEEMPASKAQK